MWLQSHRLPGHRGSFSTWFVAENLIWIINRCKEKVEAMNRLTWVGEGEVRGGGGKEDFQRWHGHGSGVDPRRQENNLPNPAIGDWHTITTGPVDTIWINTQGLDGDTMKTAATAVTRPTSAPSARRPMCGGERAASGASALTWRRPLSATTATAINLHHGNHPACCCCDAGDFAPFSRYNIFTEEEKLLLWFKRLWK